MRARLLALGIGATCLTACVLPPHDQTTETAITAQEAGLSSQPAPAIPEDWWKAFGDPQFTALVTRAFATSPTLAETLARLRSAAAASDVAVAGEFPRATFDTQEVRQRFSGTDIYPPPFARNVYWRGGLAGNLSWDVDFWGRQAALVAQARDQAGGDQLDLASARLALTTSLAQAYTDLGHAYALADIATSTLKQRQHVLAITQRLIEGGIDTQVELREAQGAVAQSQVDLERAQNQKALAAHEIALLTGSGAALYDQIKRPTLQADAGVPLPSGLPADLLARRPDILAARMRIDAALSGRKAAKAAFYPDVSLTAFAGFSSIGISDLFRYASFNYGIGPALHLPLFDAGRLKAEYRDANARIDDAVATYNDTVLRAIRETADALTEVASLRQQDADERVALDDAGAAYDLAVRRYRAGLTDYLTVLNAQTALLVAQRDLADITSAELDDRIRLLVAVGGSFDPSRDLPPIETAELQGSSETSP